jgi:hypothetical protein
MNLRRLKRKIIKTFFREQWSLLVCAPDGAILVHIVPPKNYIWADPFPVEYTTKTYIFIEQQIGYGNGTLGYIELYPDLTHSEFVPVLEKSYHLSFPHVFSMEHGGGTVWYMIPESHQNKTIDLYRAERFPDGWKHEMTLMENVDAVDSVVFRYAGKWWLFTSIGSETQPINGNLSAFYSDSFPSCAWTAHPRTPLCADAGNSRMAGGVFFDEEGGLPRRPAQSCVKEYGEKTHINEITALTPFSYNETKIKTILPERNLHAVCTHTINFSRNYMLRDIKTRVCRFFS